MKNKALYLYATFLPALALAQASLPADSGSFLDKIAHSLHDIPGTAMIAALGVVEFLLRMVPTAAPVSLLVPVKKALDMVVYIISWVSDLLAQVIVVANKVKG